MWKAALTLSRIAHCEFLSLSSSVYSFLAPFVWRIKIAEQRTTVQQCCDWYTLAVDGWAVTFGTLRGWAWAGCGLVDEFNSECTDSQLNAEHWFARIKKLCNRNRSFLCVSCLHKLFYVVNLSLDIIWSVVHLFTTVIQRLDYNISRYFVCIKCTACHKFLAGLDHKPSSVRTRLIV